MIFIRVNSYAVHPEKFDDHTRQHSKDFWIDQFKIFEKTGFTEQMMFKAKKEYFSNAFKSKMNSIIPEEKAKMMLWTVFDGDIYY